MFYSNSMDYKYQEVPVCRGKYIPVFPRITNLIFKKIGFKQLKRTNLILIQEKKLYSKQIFFSNNQTHTTNIVITGSLVYVLTCKKNIFLLLNLKRSKFLFFIN